MDTRSPCGCADARYARVVSFRDDFEGNDLDRSVWIPHYLPQWSSRAESAATYEVTGSELRLSIPAVFDFPMRSPAVEAGHVPLFVVDYVHEA